MDAQSSSLSETPAPQVSKKVPGTSKRPINDISACLSEELRQLTAVRPTARIFETSRSRYKSFESTLKPDQTNQPAPIQPTPVKFEIPEPLPRPDRFIFKPFPKASSNFPVVSKSLENTIKLINYYSSFLPGDLVREKLRSCEFPPATEAEVLKIIYDLWCEKKEEEKSATSQMPLFRSESSAFKPPLRANFEDSTSYEDSEAACWP